MFGQSYIRALLAPLPELKLMPTGGVTPSNAGQWLEAGACAVGVGSALLDRQAIAEGRYDVISERARKLMRSIAQARSAAQLAREAP